MIRRIYYSVLEIAARYYTLPSRFFSVFGEKSNYNIYKRAYGFHRGRQDFKLSQEQYGLLKSKGLIVDGTKGGLLIGPLHSQGGILIVRDYKPYPYIVAEIEGWEYVLSSEASVPNHEEIVEINGSHQYLINSTSWGEYPIPDDVSVIDLRHKLVDGLLERPLLLVKGEKQWCINKWSTKAHLKKIDSLNKSSAN